MTATARHARSVVLAGNPNAGKSTLFNQLTGGSARVGNYPGVTVEQQRGRLRLPDLTEAELLDSPGCYSLCARSEDEQIATRSVAGLPPAEPGDLVVVVIDATQLHRNLYLALQVIELGGPVVVALNMTDLLDRQGLSVDPVALSQTLGVPVVPVVARTGRGVDDLRRQIAAALHDPSTATAPTPWTDGVDAALAADVDEVAFAVPDDWHRGDDRRRHALARWALLSIDADDELDVPAALRSAVDSVRARAEASGRTLDTDLIQARYAWIDEQSPRFSKDLRRVKTITDRVDRVLLQPVLGFALFVALMVLIFQSLFTWADPLIGWIEEGFGFASGVARDALGEGVFADFLIDGVIAGVGAFVVFLPQILLLFLAIGIMEDTGYMARVAVLMDRIMKSLGLHGRAFVPLLSGYACAVPAILATRTMERRRDRMLTMMVLPLMTCAARLPVYGLLIAALYPPDGDHAFAQGMLLAGMYVFGTVVSLLVAWVLGKTLFKGPRVPFVMEMPLYRMPHWRSIFRLLGRQARDFLTTAGTIILLASIALWALLYFPRDKEISAVDRAQVEAVQAEVEAAADDEARGEAQARADALLAGAELRGSYAGRLGRALEPVFEPLGFDWKIGVGVIGAFAAREVFVATMGVVYGIGDDVDEESVPLRERLAAETWPDGRKVFTPLVILSLMIFFALACQCVSTLAVVWRETRAWTWPVFLFVYMTALAWVASFAVYQGGRLLGYA